MKKVKMNTNKSNYELKQQAVILHMQGKQGKQIAQMLHVTPKTIGNWLADVKHTDYQTLLGKLYKQLDRLLSYESNKTTDIYNLNNVIASIEKRLKQDSLIP